MHTGTLGRIVATTTLAAAITVVPVSAAAADGDGGQLSRATRAAIDGIIADTMQTAHLPGMSVLVRVPGRGSYVQTYGVADTTTGRPFRTTDHVRIASITKTFTATLILRLVDKGVLRLDDHLADFVNGIPNGRQITLRQMLNMTSGIFSYTEDEQFGQDFDAHPTEPFPPSKAIAIIKAHPPDFPPGTSWHYSDSNYLLLGVIAERVTGRPVDRLMDDVVIDPLGLGDTSYPTTPAIPSPHPAGYVAQPDGTLRDVTAVNPAVAAGAGAMISTLEDLARYAKALADGTILSARTQRERLEIVNVPLSPALTTGYGLGLLDINGFLGHDGAIYGFSTAMFHLPEKDATVVVIGNQSSNFTTPSLQAFLRIAQALFPARFPPAP
jgi:D-alanyl-D-alanine carboxypeptidase